MINPNNPADFARAELSEIEKRNSGKILSEFRALAARLEKDIDALSASGRDYERARLESVLRVVRIETKRLAFEFVAMTAAGQNKAVSIARDAFELTGRNAADVAKIDLEATREIVAAGHGKTYLSRLYSNLEPMVSSGIKDALTTGVAAGLPPVAIASEIKKVLPLATTRAMAISRTETNGAFRRASQDFYQTAPDVIGYIWTAALDLRTCPICWALHGKLFPNAEPFGTHVNCRCTCRPFFRDEKLDYKETGEHKFSQLTPAQQKTILGTGRFDLYAKQNVPLSAMVEKKTTDFGVSRYLKPLGEFKDIPTAAPTIKKPLNAKQTPPKKPVPAKTSVKTEKPVDFAFKTTADAERWARAEYPNTTFNFSGFDVRVLNPTLKEFDRLAKEFPEVAARLDTLTTRGRFESTTNAHASPDGRMIGFNPKKVSDFDEWQKKKNFAFKTNWGASDKIHSTMTHEFGHAVDSWFDRLAADRSVALFDYVQFGGRGEISDILHKWRRKYKATGDLSEYAKTNRFEAFAEGFNAIYNNPDKLQNEFVRALKILIEVIQTRRRKRVGSILDAPDAKAAAAEINAIYQKLGLS